MSPTRHEFRLPDLGEGLTDAEVLRWLVRPGDRVGVDQPVAEVETAKAVVELPCPYPGVVTDLCAEPGTVVAVGEVLLRVDDGVGPTDRVLVGSGPPAPATSPARAAPPTSDRIRPEVAPVISPLVRRLARERGVDLTRLSGSGPGGLVTRADVERAAAGPEPDDTIQRIPLRGVRRRAADQLARSRREVPDVTCWVDADATGLLAARDGSGVGLTALLARICVAGLRRFPELNARIDVDRQEICRIRPVHLGLAVQAEDALVVPVIRDADRRTTGELAAEIRRLTEAARTGRLTAADLSGGTFTLNNYGVFGVDGATPILHLPQAGMLGVGRVTARPWVHQNALAVRQVVQLSCTFDHRVCDGQPAAGFLRFVADCAERPETLLRWV